MVWAITKFHHYLTIRPFQVIRDHSALKYILTDKGNALTGRLARWKLLLQEYPYGIVYRPGPGNVTADALNCNPLAPTPGATYDESQERLAWMADPIGEIFYDKAMSSLLGGNGTGGYYTGGLEAGASTGFVLRRANRLAALTQLSDAKR